MESHSQFSVTSPLASHAFKFRGRCCAGPLAGRRLGCLSFAPRWIKPLRTLWYQLLIPLRGALGWAKLDLVCPPGTRAPEQPRPGPLSGLQEMQTPQIPGPPTHGLRIFPEQGPEVGPCFYTFPQVMLVRGCLQTTGRVARLGSGSETSQVGLERQVSLSVWRWSLWERGLGLVLGKHVSDETFACPHGLLRWRGGGRREKSVEILTSFGGQQHLLCGPRGGLKGMRFGN